jgi:signal transduction histidine kinase
MSGPSPSEESARLAALRQYSLLDTRPEDAFDDLTNLASLICATPIALVSLMDSGRIWFKSKVGLNVSEIPRIDNFCSSVILSDQLLIVPDAAADHRLASHPLVKSAPKVRFYAGAPLITASGQRIGSLCVVDTVPRQIDDDQASALQSIARVVVTQLELRHSARQSAASAQWLRDLHLHTETQVSERTKQLAAAHQSLQLLTRQLMQAQEDERRRIARELHDETGQLLAALNMTVDGMLTEPSDRNRTGLEQCKELLMLAISEIRNLSYLLHPPLMDKVGLTSAVSEYVRGFERRSGITVQIEVSEKLGRLEQDREIALFRILQESFVNIHRHSGSSTASVALSANENSVVLEISDHGKGFPVDPGDSSHFGLGIRSMRERLRHFGGNLQLRSSTSGATIRAELPRVSSPALFLEQSD